MVVEQFADSQKLPTEAISNQSDEEPSCDSISQNKIGMLPILLHVIAQRNGPRLNVVAGDESKSNTPCFAQEMNPPLAGGAVKVLGHINHETHGRRSDRQCLRHAGSAMRMPAQD